MNNLRVARVVYALLLTFGYFNWMRVYPKLPQRIAVHFGHDGTPNGWTPKDGLLWTTLIVLAILSITTMGIPRLVTAASDDRMNLPHRAYWLAPERRKQTMGFIEAQGIWFGCAVLLLLYTAFQWGCGTIRRIKEIEPFPSARPRCQAVRSCTCERTAREKSRAPRWFRRTLWTPLPAQHHPIPFCDISSWQWTRTSRRISVSIPRQCGTRSAFSF